MIRLIAMVGLAWPLLATAQTRSSTRIPVDAGDSMRVIMHSGLQLLGELVAQTRDSVGLRRATDGRITDTVVALGDISFVESTVDRHTAHSALAGLRTGLLAGAAAGVILAAIDKRNCQSDCGYAVLAIPVLGVAGGLTGLVVGSLRTTERWEVVWRPDAARP